MPINHKNIFTRFKWLKQKRNKFIISSDYDGLICASFLSHYLNWELVGYYNMEKIWVSQRGLDAKKSLIWVDLNIVPKIGKAIGGHITICKDQMPEGLNSSCNPNILMKLTEKDFKNKFPFSTLIFLLWLYKYKIPTSEMAKFFILHSDSTWMKIQKYPSNTNKWMNILTGFQWGKLFNNIESMRFEKNIDQKFYPLLSSCSANTGYSKLKSKHLGIQSRECILNPDWDEDIMLNLFELFGQSLSWNPPKLPQIISKIKGKKYSIALSDVKKIGLNKLIKEKKIFSYAITSSKTLKYTVFNPIR